MDLRSQGAIGDSLDARNIFEAEASAENAISRAGRGLMDKLGSERKWNRAGSLGEKGSKTASLQKRYDLIRDISGASDGKDVCRALSRHLPPIIPFDVGSLRWKLTGQGADQDICGSHSEDFSENLEFTAGSGLFNSMDDLDLDLEIPDGSPAFSSRTRLGHVHRGRAEDGRVLSFEVRSTLVIPLSHDDRQIGTLSFFSGHPEGFHNADKEMIGDIGSITAGVLGRMLEVECALADLDRQKGLTDSCRDLIITWRNTRTSWEVDFNSRVEEYFTSTDLNPEILSGPFFVPPGDDLERADEAWVHAYTTGEETMVDLELMDRKGTAKPVLCIFSPLIEEGDLLGVRMTGIEVEDLDRTMVDLERMNNSYRLMLSVISHDLKNPLTTILGYTEILSSKTEEGNRKYLDRIIRTVGRMNETITLTKLFSQIWEGKVKREFTEIDIGEMIAGSIETLYPRTSRYDIRFDLKKGTSGIVGLSLLEQVFQNLLDNAMKYSPEGSMIGIDLETDLNGVTISVSDEGIGVPKESRETIFDRFKRGCRSGVMGIGLGLSISKDIVELHNGRIWVEPNHPGGSIFRTYLPWNPVG